ncbi:RusA family crossover junction endodeoxyribonuclease [Paenibacillus sp. CMAA1739]|uniref:RusA family crossover junction endodeoxyribonuclease n=1 Tax=Paenibacillus ottowii TaxID=2315729 RepID=UPI002DBDD01B|nr:RusA family crossover junction endodeoxyribonuclease [Paenibacillus sp. CMAA1739]MEC4569479.1 RusA family crossover junction endodeoxyribonuclease [Paenibacillus sp. CMAA1739]
MSRLILPGLAPSVNHMYQNAMVRGRRMRIKTEVAERWFADTILRAKVWQRGNKWSTATGKVVVRLWFYFPDKRRRDTHNALKALLDALEDAGMYEDDKMALPQIIDCEIDRKNPRIEIEFEKMTG